MEDINIATSDALMKKLNANTIELHYCFSDKEHRIDAFIENRCEYELLLFMKEISKYVELEFIFETELTQAGGIRKFFKLIPTNLSKSDNKKIAIGIITALYVNIATTCLISPLSIAITESIKYAIHSMFEDKELSELQKEKLREEIKALKLDNQKKQEEIEKNEQLKIRRSNFYEILNNYERLESVEFIGEDEDKNRILEYGKISQDNFKDYIIVREELTDQIIENAKIVIISPVLTKMNKNIKWKGLYNGELITLTMKSEEFITSIDDGLIEFKNGFIITCNLRIEREKTKSTEEKHKYIVTEVISYIVDDKILETLEGKAYKQLKKENEAIQDLPFDELKQDETDK
ncbi:hypothetical protein [Treponema pedis]|uniref:Uncharacterized protein n=1 Tax=Treponema pedis str. T A4 TaxID=1291379 RepID=S6A8A6_9SPIR|nr:hypothetical protein [Treponema pedis]AGT43494.1 hypothetical protein TPE_0998 [Treponema pedis str. T A4]QSI04300.1 hypothetical protein DYQ05_04805 [Treponema pedis]